MLLGLKQALIAPRSRVAEFVCRSRVVLSGVGTRAGSQLTRIEWEQKHTTSRPDYTGFVLAAGRICGKSPQSDCKYAITSRNCRTVIASLKSGIGDRSSSRSRTVAVISWDGAKMDSPSRAAFCPAW